MKRTKYPEVDQYKGAIIRIKQHFGVNSKIKDIPIGADFKITKPPKGKKNNFIGVWISFQGVKRSVLLAEVVFISNFGKVFKRTK